jgi:hypothetical protein
VVESAGYHRCENESCRGFFFRQRDRAAYGQYRKKGVIYCSTDCARAQEQRKLRRNQASAAGLAKKGYSMPAIAAELGADPAAVERWLRAVEKRRDRS